MRRILKFIKTLIFIGVVALVLLFAIEKFDIDINIFGKHLELPNDEYDSKYISVLNRENKNEIARLNHNTKAYPASLTKIMTTIVALEHIDDLSAVAPIDRDTYKKMVANNSSMAGFYSHEQVTYRDLLYGTILSSGGETANSLAINISGNVDQFVLLMNEKADELKLKNTHFTNPEGLHDENQYTTAYDMAKLLDYALDNEDFKAIFTKKTFQTTSTLDHPGGLNLQSTVLSKLHRFPQNGFNIIGGKSGTTGKAGSCWATLAIKNDIEYIAIVMGSELKDVSKPNNKHIEDTIKLYENIE